MKKSHLPIAAATLLLLTGCSTATTTTAPQNTASAPASSEAAPVVSEPSDTKASATNEPSPDVSTSSSGKTFFAGTTLKGNDISFEILDDETQTFLNENTQSAGLVGAWGRLCSATALPEQLEETGVLTVSPVNGDSFVWRSMKYAVVEGGRYSADEAPGIAAAFSDAGQSDVAGMNCTAVNTDLKFALDYDYDSVTVGQYVGSMELLNAVEIF